MEVNIRQISTNRKNFLDLLLLADPDEKMVLSYIHTGEMFVLYEENIPASLALVIKSDGNIVEIKNLATHEDKQGKGYASQLINYISHHYKEYFDYLIIATANSSLNNLIFYKSLGFSQYKTIKNFFIDNYDQPIFEEGIQARDLIYLKKSI